ncbi:interleukin-13 receptor subunit alpha-2-like [Megalops cyprinoides]|uniref:interleukin-13 receptor subunit alpha-2-like n=1 Tax=Megalops cyprinoides TaxID=118141 RepID=UPI001863CC4E|nr:interleukin-13 receptor subunit alpha-2-like [Megalops cyprinoides]
MKYEGMMELSAMLPLLLTWSQFIASYGITVNPPVNLEVTDPGHLGQLHIHWTLPASLENLTDCLVRFQLQYFNTYEDTWAIIRTTQLSYSAQFDLEKDAHVRVSTLLRGPCVNGSEVQSLPVEAVLKPHRKGPMGSKVKGLSCIFYQKEYMECTWEKGDKELPHPQYRLFYWHRGMQQAMECPGYMYLHGARTGCSFPWDSLMEFTDFNICVNGSSSHGPVRPAYFTLQIQDHVKPAAIKTLSLEALPSGYLHLEWTLSAGKISDICLEYEVESRHKGLFGELLRNITRETTLTSLSMDQGRTHCFRVRSRVHQFCADSSFWSEWSQPSCLSGTTRRSQTATDALHASVSLIEVEEAYNPTKETILLCTLAISVIAVFTLSLCLWNVRRTLKIHKGKKGVFFFPYGPKGDFTSPSMDANAVYA